MSTSSFTWKKQYNKTYTRFKLQVPLSKIKEFVRIKKISGYVECSAMNDPESVKKVFEKACKLGLSQVTGISIPTDDVDGLMQDDENVGCFDKFFKKCNKQ